MALNCPTGYTSVVSNSNQNYTACIHNNSITTPKNGKCPIGFTGAQDASGKSICVDTYLYNNTTFGYSSISVGTPTALDMPSSGRGVATGFAPSANEIVLSQNCTIQVRNANGRVSTLIFRNGRLVSRT